MKADVAKILKNSKILLGLAIAISVILVGALVPTLLLPRFRHWRSLQETNQTDTQKLAVITANLAVLADQDREKISEYKTLMSAILPVEEDTLRVLAILDQIIKNSGMALDSLQVKTAAAGAAKTIPVQTPASQPTGTKALGVTTTQPPTTTSALSANSFQIGATLHGNLSSVLALIETLDSVKRAIGTTSVSLSKATGAERPTVNINFVMPLGKKVAAASADTKVEMASSDEKTLEELIGKLIIDALPATSPLGQPEPFGR